MKPLYGSMLLASLVLLPSARATDGNNAPGPNEKMLVGDNFGGFLESQPDLLHYRMGLEAYRDGDATAAMRHFLIAARYADKPSQALVAQMYWDGVGVARDRALAYAWMDLAAERGNARLLAQRERYWEALDEAQRTDALERGQRVYAQYGDDVAKRRIEFVLRRKKNQLAGSRTGYTGNATVLALVPGTSQNLASAEGTNPAEVPPLAAMAAASFYHPTYWQPGRRYAWREQQWEREFQAGTTGTAEVGELKQLRPGPPAD